MRAEVLEETIRLELEQQAERFGARIRAVLAPKSRNGETLQKGCATERNTRNGRGGVAPRRFLRSG